MKKILLGVLIGLGLTFAFIGAKADLVQELAWQQKVADIQYPGIYRFEWFGDVCYNVIASYGVAISCLKK